MVPQLSLAAELEVAHAQQEARRMLRERPEALGDLLCSLLAAHAIHQKMVNGALARVIELQANLALAEMNAAEIANRYAALQARVDDGV
jgi:hypothetical protein